MGKKKKSFIDRKNATTFRLIHRSQKDPLIADNEVGDRIFHPVLSKELEQRSKYGIYYTDNYNYLQHLKTVGEAIDMGEVDRTVIQAPVDSTARRLPSVIFETPGIKLKVGMLNKAAPTNELMPDVDPEIAAALEGEFDDAESFGDFDDDFVVQLNAEGDGTTKSTALSANPLKDESAGKSALMERFGLTRKQRFSDESSDDEDEEADTKSVNMEDDREERRSRFTNYSMSSAVIKRPDGLQIIDEHFETLYEQYDDEKCGEMGVEAEMITGHIDPKDEFFKQLVDDYTHSKRPFVPERPSTEVKELALKYDANTAEKESETESDFESEDENPMRKRRWDCESILSTYSNTKNHPLVIKDETAATGSSKRRRHNDTKTILEDMDDTESVYTTATITSLARPRGETTEERRVRKSAVREGRRARRAEKKLNKGAFKDLRKEFAAQRSSVQVNTRPIR